MTTSTRTSELQVPREYLTDRPDVAGEAGSPWLAGREKVARPALDQRLVADVIVVGGGLCGVLTAYRLVHAGARVILLEARRIGGGVTGHTTAKVTAQHGLLSAKLDLEVAAQWLQANVVAVDRLEALASSVRPAAHFRRVDSHVYVTSEAGVDKVTREAELFYDLGLDGGLIAEEELPGPALAAVRLSNQAQFDPVGLIDGLLETAPDTLTVFEDSQVREVIEGKDYVSARTDQGEVRADSIVLASNVPFFDTLYYVTRLFQERTYAIEVQPEQPVRPGMWYSPDEDAISWRPTGEEADGRMVVSGVHHKAGHGGDERKCYSALGMMTTSGMGPLQVLRHWSTQDPQTPDHLPYIGKMHGRDRCFVATGFGGWGMTTSWIAADVLTALTSGGDHGVAELVTPARIGASGVGRMAVENADVMVKGVTHEVSGHADPESVAPGGGATMRADHQHLAVARSFDGTLHVSDAHCTHMRCGVEFNEAEETWDCPCHGSRYLADGTWLHGPTRRGLDPPSS